MEVEFVLGKSAFGEHLISYYDPENERAYVFLSALTERYGREDELVQAVVRCVIHESLHHAFKVILGPADEERIRGEHWVMKVIGQY